ncbi:MAG: hypothetical protein WD934_06590 [Gemmatimonadales bacterium]
MTDRWHLNIVVPMSPTDLPDPLKGVREAEDHWVQYLGRAFSDGALGVRGAALYSALSSGVDMLAGVAACRFGCRRSDHHMENVTRRLVNAVLASLRLGRAGYIDEAAGLVRVVAELSNLCQLFLRDPTMLEIWLSLSDKDRWSRFKPVAVRKHLEASGEDPVYTAANYRALCDVGVHVTPGSAVASHDLEADRLIVGPSPPIPGVLFVWTELAFAISRLLPMYADAGFVPDAHADHCVNLCAALSRAIGGGEMRVTQYNASLEWFRNQVRDADLR